MTSHVCRSIHTDEAIQREAIAQAVGPYQEVALHEQRTGRVARHRAETPITAAIHHLNAEMTR